MSKAKLSDASLPTSLQKKASAGLMKSASQASINQSSSLTIRNYEGSDKEMYLQNTEFKVTKVIPVNSSPYGGQRLLREQSNKSFKEKPVSEFQPLNKVLSAKFATDFIPGQATAGSSANSEAIQKAKNIISNCNLLKSDSLAVIDLQKKLKDFIKEDRAAVNPNRAPSLYENFEYFKKQFQLRKYEIEDYFIRRRSEKPSMSLVTHTKFSPKNGMLKSTVSSFKLDVLEGRVSLSKFAD